MFILYVYIRFIDCQLNANLIKIDVLQIPYEIFVFKLHTVFEYSAVLTADSNIETLPLRISSCFVKRQQIQSKTLLFFIIIVTAIIIHTQKSTQTREKNFFVLTSKRVQ